MTGAKHLFIPGPTNVPERVRMAMNVPMEDIRAPDFPHFTLPLFQDLKKIFRTDEGQVFIFPSSGTGAWEASLSNTLSPGDKVIVSSLGVFSMLWAKMCRDLGLDVIEYEEEWGDCFPLERLSRDLEADTAREIKAVLVCQNETTTGVVSDVQGVRGLLDQFDHPALLFVDGVSSIGSIDFRMDDWGVDLAVTGSQKGLMLPTGLGIVAVSQKALEATRHAGLKRSYFSFDWHAGLNAQGYFPYTPATVMLRGLRESLDMIFEEGLDNVIARHRRIADGVRAGIAAWGLDLCAKRPEIASDTVSTVMLPEGIDGNHVITTAYHRYNCSFGKGLIKLDGRAFRIGHLGYMDEGLALTALSLAELAMLDAGVELAPGSGVGAAVSSYSRDGSELRVAA